MTKHIVHAGGLMVVALCVARPAVAQGTGDGFLFKTPAASLTLRAGFSRPTAGGDILSFVTNQLTLTRGDFNSLTLGLELGFPLPPEGELVFGVAYAGTSTRSEFRDWVDQNDLPIEQSTTFKRVPVTVTAKWYFTPRGRAIGRFAWVPARYAAYVGIGGGAMWYRFRQTGDFIDFTDNGVFRDTFNSSRWTKTAHALGGLDVSLGPRFFVTGEGRYTLAKAELSRDFIGFDPIDLSGFSATAGIAVRF